MSRLSRIGLTSMAAGLAAGAAFAHVELATPFSDNMVLQRNRAVPVWGTADPGECVCVSFFGSSVKTTADAKGAWRVKLPAMPASKENRAMTVKGSANEVVVRNVLVGEVWFASGQSNMECPIWGEDPRYRDGKGAMMLQMTHRPFVRYAKNPRVWSVEPKKRIDVVWREMTPESSAKDKGFHLSAVAFYFALELWNALDVPIGIIDSSWGGTNIDAWTPREAYAKHPALKDVADYPVADKWKPEMHWAGVNGLPNQPTVLWNGMMNAWAPFAIRGFIWYQGCHNAGEPSRYCEKMHALYDGWSAAFENPGLRLYFAELAPYKDNWFMLQQAQHRFAAEEMNADYVVTCDCGNQADIHPNDKEIVAKRLALHALRRDYGFKDIEDCSPAPKGWKVDTNGVVTLTFDHADAWYYYNDDRSAPKGFEIAGLDGVFKPARILNKASSTGILTGRDLQIAADGVANPRCVRYLANVPQIGSLYAAKSSLPLGSFEIDTQDPHDRCRNVMANMAKGDAPSFKLAVRGEKPDCPIVLPAKPKPTEVRAAEELQDYVERITGVRLPIKRGAFPEKGVFVSIVDDGKLGEDGFRLAVKDGRLTVVGGKRGVLYGVYELLEKYGHVGWFTSWRTVVPKATSFTVPGTLDDEQVPAFVMRDMSWKDTCENSEFAAHMRLNGPRRDFPAALGGTPGYRFAPGLGASHTVSWLMPPAEFAKDHPEYYGLVDGKRVTWGRVQLCLTNPDVLRICTERVLKAVREHPECQYFGVSQGDATGTVCTCEKCLASDRKYGDAPSGTFLAFVNAIAEEVEKVRPDAIVETLAYRYTRKPPVGIRPRHNVMPCLCTAECDFSRPISEGGYHENVAFQNDIRGWCKISPFVYVWDYTVNFSHYAYPFADFKAIQGNLRFFRECGVKQMFEQGNREGLYTWFGELKAYLLAKLEWNPDADVVALTDAFFAGYYGPAADLARADFDEIHAFLRGGQEDPLTIEEEVTAARYPDAFFERSAARWAEATKRVENMPEYQWAVRGGQFSSDYVRVQRYLTRVVLSRDAYRFSKPDPKELVAAARRIDALLRDPPTVRLSEGHENNGNYVASIRALARMPPPIIGSDSVQLGTERFVTQPGKAVRVKDPETLSGEAYLFDGTHHYWSVRLDADRFVVDPGAKHRVRVRFRAAKTGQKGEVFRAGVYDPVAKKAVCTFVALDTDVTGSGYAWYDLFSWEPKGKEFFWLSPGVYDDRKQQRNEAITSLAVDRIELTRE